jgi:hypothetical protein
VIFWASLLLGGVLILVFNTRYVKNFVFGPYAIHGNDLAQIANAETAAHYFISAPAEKVIDTGIQEVTTSTENGAKKDSSVTAGYYGVLVGNNFLIAKSATKPATKVTGELKSFPADLSAQLFSGAEGPDLQSRCYPFYLDTEGFRTAGYWGIGIGLVFLFVLWKFGRTAWTRLQDVNQHPVVRRVQQWGDPIGISFEAERELQSGVRYKAGGIFITDKYVITNAFFSFDLLRFEDLLWAYKKVTKRSVNFIPTGKDYDAMLVMYGGVKTFRAKEKVVEEVLAFAATRAPWAIVGYSAEIANLYSKHQAEFCQAVEARKHDAIKGKV